MITRVIGRLQDPSRFTTHELHQLVQEMTVDDLRGIPFARAILRRISDPMTFSMFIRGHPDIVKHKDGVVNLAQYGEKRLRSGVWSLKTASN